ADSDSEEELLRVAGVFTISQLERILRVYKRITSSEARDAHEGESLDYYWDEDGSLVLKARLPAEDGALLLCALDAARERLRERRQDTSEEQTAEAAEDSEPKEPWQGDWHPRNKRVEALVALAEDGLAREHVDRTGGERYQLVVHVDQGALEEDAEGRCELEDGPALANET